MRWSLPIEVETNGKRYAITQRCDFRMVLDCINALNDENLDVEDRVVCALIIFYEDLCSVDAVYDLDPTEFEELTKEMYKIIGYTDDDPAPQTQKPKLMDWEHDYKIIAPSISHILGYDVRDPQKYTHWHSWLGGYMEIQEGIFQTVVSIRSKKFKGTNLEKHEKEFYRNNRNLVDLPLKITDEEQEELNSEW